MNAYEIADELEEKFGNEYAPKQFDIIKQAIVELRKLAKQLEEVSK